MKALAGRIGSDRLLQAARRTPHGGVGRTADRGCGAGHIQRISVTASSGAVLTRAISITAPNVWGALLSANSSRNSGINAVSSGVTRSEEHTSELQSPKDLVCRLLLE